tara:strand:+ start:299 stop:691 length:393 start_codon:yes stop_codon:yes gene_type:complete
MGYRSHVVFAVDKMLMGKFMAHISQVADAKNLCFVDNTEMVEHYAGNGNFLFRWESIKWYDEYKEVDCINDFMDKADDMVLDGLYSDDSARSVRGGEYYRFIRTGENSEDIEERGEGFEIYTETSVDIVY